MMVRECMLDDLESMVSQIAEEPRGITDTGYCVHRTPSEVL
jgi:hypothetical protein